MAFKSITSGISSLKNMVWGKSEDETKKEETTAAKVPEKKTEKKKRHSIASTRDSRASAKKEDLKRTKEKVNTTVEKMIRETTNPTGVIAIHMRKLTLDFIDLYNLLQRFDATFYIRISCQGQIKCSLAFEDVVVPSVLVMDEIKHFRVSISSTRADPENRMKIQLIAYNKADPTVHKVVSAKDIHLFDIVKQLIDVMAITLVDHKRFINVGALHVEICFTHGSFGYGYSSQFLNQTKVPQEQIKHSMFYRSEPPPHRDDPDSDVMMCKHQGHPVFIDFYRKSSIGISSDFAEDIEAFPDIQAVQEPTVLIAEMKRRSHHLLSEYRSQNDRIQRLSYLRHLVSKPGRSKELSADVIIAEPDYALEVGNKAKEEVKEDDMQVLKLLQPVLENVGGLQNRMRRGNIGGPGSRKGTGNFFTRMVRRSNATSAEGMTRKKLQEEETKLKSLINKYSEREKALQNMRNSQPSTSEDEAAINMKHVKRRLTWHQEPNQGKKGEVVMSRKLTVYTFTKKGKDDDEDNPALHIVD